MVRNIFRRDRDISIAPGVSILGVLKNLNYEPWFALAEFVDNAIASANRESKAIKKLNPDFELKVTISYDGDDGGRLTIRDNAGGIKRDEFDRAFKAAEAPPDNTGLSEFGMGMKSASIWFAKNWKVRTTSIGDSNEYLIEFDMRDVIEQQKERLDVLISETDPVEHFTQIELWELNQFLRGRTLGKVRDHLREIYRSYLRAGDLELVVANELLSYEDPEILNAIDYRLVDVDPSAKPVQWRKDLSFEIGNGIKVEGWAALRAEGKTSGNGLSLFRRNRLIVGTSENPYRPESIFGSGNSYRSQRLFGELAIDGLSVSHTKDGFQWAGLEDEFLTKLRKQLNSDPLPLLQQAEQYRARKATSSELNRVRMAAENTAAAIETGLPVALAKIEMEDGLQPEPLVELPAKEITAAEKEFNFIHNDVQWVGKISAIQMDGDPRWLTQEVKPSESNFITVEIALNISHNFVRQFALKDLESLEVLFRLGVAIAISRITLDQMNEPGGPNFMRNVNAILTDALAGPTDGMRA